MPTATATSTGLPDIKPYHWTHEDVPILAEHVIPLSHHRHAPSRFTHLHGNQRWPIPGLAARMTISHRIDVFVGWRKNSYAQMIPRVLCSRSVGRRVDRRQRATPTVTIITSRLRSHPAVNLLIELAVRSPFPPFASFVQAQNTWFECRRCLFPGEGTSTADETKHFGTR
jgi:hypothetical protein